MHPNQSHLPSPLAAMCDDHALQLCLCDALEAVADGLPGVNSALVQRTIDALCGGLLEEIGRRQQIAFDNLLQNAAGNRALDLIAIRLLDEQAHDACGVEELSDALRELVRQEQASNAEVTGYLLRGFFQARRRHIAWQTEVLIPLVREFMHHRSATSSSDSAAAAGCGPSSNRA
jgi:hypothetical protein